MATFPTGEFKHPAGTLQIAEGRITFIPSDDVPGGLFFDWKFHAGAFSGTGTGDQLLLKGIPRIGRSLPMDGDVFSVSSE